MSLFSKIFGDSGTNNIDEYVEYMHEKSSEFDSDEDYLDSLKQDDSYHFSIPFNYYENSEDEDGKVGYMEVDVDWSSSNHGYGISYYFAEDYGFDSTYNGDVDEIYHYHIESEVIDELLSKGIPIEAIES